MVVAPANFKYDPEPCVQLPAPVNDPATVTIPELLFVTVPVTVTAAPKDILLEPDKAYVPAANVAVPEPELKVVPFITISPPQLVTLVNPLNERVPPLFTVTELLNVTVPVLLEVVNVPETFVVPAKVIFTPPKVKVPLGTDSNPQVEAKFKTLVPVETSVVVLSIEAVPPEEMVPVKLTVAAPVVVNWACAAVPEKVIPPVVVIVPVVAESTEFLPVELPPTILKPFEINVPEVTANCFVTEAVGALIVTDPLTVKVTPFEIVIEAADVPPVKLIEATVTLVLAVITTALSGMVTVSEFPFPGDPG